LETKCEWRHLEGEVSFAKADPIAWAYAPIVPEHIIEKCAQFAEAA